MRYVYALFWLLLGCLFCSVSALAGVHVEPMILTFEGDQRSLDFRVTNDDKDKVAYAAIQVEAYQKPVAHSDLKISPKPAEVLNPSQSGLLVSPTKLVLPPGGNRLVRVRLLQPPSQSERRYIVRVMPVEGQVASVTAANNETKAGVRIIVAYGVTVIVPPLKPKS